MIEEKHHQFNEDIEFTRKLKQPFGNLACNVLQFYYRRHADDGTEYIEPCDPMCFGICQYDFEELISLCRNYYTLVSDEQILAKNYERLYSKPQIDHSEQIHKKQRQRRMRSGWVYILNGGSYYKIGKAINITDRIKSFSPLLPFKVEILHTIQSNDYTWAEKSLHEKFAEKRSNGEWFELDALDISWLLSVKKMNVPEAIPEWWN